MGRPYRHAREHLEDELAWVRQLLHRQIVAGREAGAIDKTRDEFTGTFVSPAQLRAALQGDVGAPASLADLDAALVHHLDHVEARLDATRAAGAPLPWDLLRRNLGLSASEQRVLAILLAFELRPRLRDALRYLTNDAGRIYADVGLLDALVYQAPAFRDALLPELSPDGKLARYRLVEWVGGRRASDDALFWARPLKLHPRVIELAHGVLQLDRELAGCAELVATPPPLDALLLDDAVRDHVVGLVRDAIAAPAGAAAPVIVLTGSEGAGRRALLMAAAGAAGRRILRVRCDELPRELDELGRTMRSMLREARLAAAVPLLEHIELLTADADAGRVDRTRVIDAALAGHAGAVLATAGRSDSRPIRLDRGLVVVDLPRPTEALRAQLWQRALGGDAALAARAAARYPITPGTIERSAASAHAQARARGAAPTLIDIHEGVRSTLDAKLSNLGLRITWRQRWDDLVLPEDALAEVREFVARVRHKRRVYEDWGFARKVAKGLGLSALFSGAPGTGKTMVAGLIAEELGLDLYQIDLSRIVSKYVGETEKNLAQLFDAAEAGHAILLFDEADSLFAKRTEVKSSVDRYANLEVNYLLQRMEQFAGITILTTNNDTAIDEAFRRRLSFRIDFPVPDAAERHRLWQAMVPPEAGVDDDIDWEQLANKFVMTGGYIRNAMLRAAFFAAEDDAPITMRHLNRAAHLEYAAMGKVMSMGMT